MFGMIVTKNALTVPVVPVPQFVGMEYRCYPFQVDLVLPFLPKSRTDRVISSGLDEGGTSQTDQTVDRTAGILSLLCLSATYAKRQEARGQLKNKP